MDAESESHDSWQALKAMWLYIKDDWRGPNADHFRTEFMDGLEWEANRHMRALAALAGELEHARRVLLVKD